MAQERYRNEDCAGFIEVLKWSWGEYEAINWLTTDTAFIADIRITEAKTIAIFKVKLKTLTI